MDTPDSAGTALQPEPTPNPTGSDFGFTLGGYVTPAGTLEGVGFGRRACAQIIDLVLHYIIAFIGGFFLGMLLTVMAMATGQSFQTLYARFLVGPQWPGFILALVGFFFYRCICEGLHGSTLGKLLLGMTVVQEDGTPCRFKSAAIRSIAYYMDGIFFGLVGYMSMKKTTMRQRYGDEWAHTVVCRRSQIKPENRRGAGAFAGALALAILTDGLMMMIGYVLRMG